MSACFVEKAGVKETEPVHYACTNAPFAFGPFHGFVGVPLIRPLTLHTTPIPLSLAPCVKPHGLSVWHSANLTDKCNVI